ncbi:MAG: hypothetical protein ACI8WT_004739 [Clostridium sp.]|jgi:hypothetical protein
MNKYKFKKTKSKKACMACPFRRVNTNEKPNPGGSHPFVYIGQAMGPFWLPCHQDKSYSGKNSNISEVDQCRGAAIFRSNCNTGIQRPKELLVLPEDKENVFASEKEFLNHYLDLSEKESEYLSRPEMIGLMMSKELNSNSKTKREYK